MNNTEYYLSIGEPWDFISPDGQNVINGELISVLSDICLVFKANYILDFDGQKGDIFVLWPRHKYLGNDFNCLISGSDYVTVNGGLLLREYNDKLTEKELEANSRFVIIGGIQKKIIQ